MRPEEILARDGARKILRDYENPPAEGTRVPRVWVEEHAAELIVAADVEELMLGDLGNFKPTGFLQAMTGPAPGYVEIANADGVRWHQRVEGDA